MSKKENENLFLFENLIHFNKIIAKGIKISNTIYIRQKNKKIYPLWKQIKTHMSISHSEQVQRQNNYKIKQKKMNEINQQKY